MEVKDQQLEKLSIFQSILIMVTYIKWVCVFRYKYILYCLSMYGHTSSIFMQDLFIFSKHSFGSEFKNVYNIRYFLYCIMKSSTLSRKISDEAMNFLLSLCLSYVLFIKKIFLSIILWMVN